VTTLTSVVIPNRPAFRAQEVCEIADVQSYVLRTWEAEFPDLGVAKTPNGPRIYRRADVERVLRIKHLILVDGFTLAGARRHLGEQVPAAASDGVTDSDVAALMDGALQQELRDVRRGLQWILGVLSDSGVSPLPFVEASARSGGAGGRKATTTTKAVSASARASRPGAAPKAKARPAKAAPKTRKR
jgi:DNA-binding transcriptional MerR regulator